MFKHPAEHSKAPCPSQSNSSQVVCNDGIAKLGTAHAEELWSLTEDGLFPKITRHAKRASTTTKNQTYLAIFSLSRSNRTISSSLVRGTHKFAPVCFLGFHGLSRCADLADAERTAAEPMRGLVLDGWPPPYTGSSGGTYVKSLTP